MSINYKIRNKDWKTLLFLGAFQHSILVIANWNHIYLALFWNKLLRYSWFVFLINFGFSKTFCNAFHSLQLCRKTNSCMVNHLVVNKLYCLMDKGNNYWQAYYLPANNNISYWLKLNTEKRYFVHSKLSNLKYRFYTERGSANLDSNIISNWNSTALARQTSPGALS